MAQQLSGYLPDFLGKIAMKKAGVDSLTALYSAIDSVRRGGTISLSGVYGRVNEMEWPVRYRRGIIGLAATDIDRRNPRCRNATIRNAPVVGAPQEFASTPTP